VGIVFGVARSEPRSKSASAGAKPGGFEAPETIPSSLRELRGGDSFRSRSVRTSLKIRQRWGDDLKNILLITEEFLDAKRVRTL